MQQVLSIIGLAVLVSIPQALIYYFAVREAMKAAWRWELRWRERVNAGEEDHLQVDPLRLAGTGSRRSVR